MPTSSGVVDVESSTAETWAQVLVRHPTLLFGQCPALQHVPFPLAVEVIKAVLLHIPSVDDSLMNALVEREAFQGRQGPLRIPLRVTTQAGLESPTVAWAHPLLAFADLVGILGRAVGLDQWPQCWKVVWGCTPPTTATWPHGHMLCSGLRLASHSHSPASPCRSAATGTLLAPSLTRYLAGEIRGSTPSSLSPMRAGFSRTVQAHTTHGRSAKHKGSIMPLLSRSPCQSRLHPRAPRCR